MLIEKIQMAKEQNNCCKPQFFELSNISDRQSFEQLLDRGNIFIHDEIYGQLKALLKSRNPRRKFTDEEYDAIIKEHAGEGPLEEYGVWVYYSWANRLVHILGEEEFVELRTSANRNKITIAERDLLATKKVGVIGLSVGQAVSVVLAMERGCGELRLADFDTIELNNLNRLRTGLHNLELMKAYAVAREIAEIDPYFKVVCYPDGVTDSNIDDFLTEGGRLDMVIDECDGIDIKLLCRIKAKELNIPVLMESSDRSTLDVERYDLEPNRSIMHGYLDHLPINFDVLKNLKTNEEKLPYMLPLTGLETLSTRMKASMIEIPLTISTWPQLATSVAMGGALTADTCRRIFLDQFTDSGRYYIDLENLIRDIRPKRKGYEPDDAEPEPITEPEMSLIANAALKNMNAAAYMPTDNEIKELVSAAIMAPSAGNSQPWKWYHTSNSLFLFRDNNYFTSYGDIEGMESYMAYGAAIENIKLEAYRKKLGVTISMFPLNEYRNLIATIQFSKDINNMAMYKPETLVQYIDTRITNRNAGVKTPLSKDEYKDITEAMGTTPGLKLQIKDKQEDLNELAAILGECDRLKLLTPVTHFEFYKKMRWSRQESEYTEDGIHIEEMGLSQPEVIALRLVKKPEVIQLLSDWKAGQALAYTTYNKVITSSAIMLMTMPELSPENSVQMGEAMQQVWLMAAANDIAIQPMQDQVVEFIHLQNNRDVAANSDEITALYGRFRKIFDIEDAKAFFLLRVNKGISKPNVKSYRKAIGKVLFSSKNQQ